MVRRCLFALVFATAAAAGCSASHGGDGGDSTASLPLAAGAAITGIDLYQGTRVPIMEGGDAADPGLAPIVGGRDALVRVFIETEDGFDSRDLIARVVLSDEDGEVSFTKQKEVAAGASTQANLGSTINVEIAGEDLRPGQSIAVSLHEVSEDVDEDGDTEDAVWPSGDPQELEIEDEMPPMKIVLVPVEYNADGSGRLPDTSDTALAAYEKLFEAMYPITSIEISVDEPLPWSQTVAAMGGGWDSLLNAVTSRRSDNGAADDEYYFGLVTPAETFNAFCGGGCVTGLSWSVTQLSPSMQAGLGIGYGGVALQYSTYTAAHEVGHLFGRLHAPCQVAQGVDQDYPYSGGMIGVMGYNAATGALMSPTVYADVMSYCTQVWISDYNYAALFERVQAVAALGGEKAWPEQAAAPWATIVVHADGTVEQGPTLVSTRPILGEPRPLTLLDGAGGLVESVDGAFVPYSEMGGGIVAFPAPGLDVAAVRLEGLPDVGLR
jgi:hypothetical protein